MDNKKKISILIPVYNTEAFLRKSLDSLINQSYKNLEIIVVNDCSLGDCDQIMAEYTSSDSRIKYLKHEKNRGLFQARITASKEATGDFIAFLDSDDYVSVDYYRTLIEKAIESDSDIVMSNFVLEYDDGTQNIYNLFNDKRLNLKGEEVMNSYFDQEGLSFDWHTLHNKIYKKSLWDKAFPHYQKITTHLIMTEDFSFSTVMFYYAKSLIKLENDSNALFYCQHAAASTSTVGIKFSKVEKNLADLKTSFMFVENFLKEVGVYDKYKVKFNKWKTLYYGQHRRYILDSNLSNDEKEKAKVLLSEFCPNPVKLQNESYIYNFTTKWNDGLEKIKLSIINPKYEYISFDIFDTLISRPFFNPIDMFEFLNAEFRELTKVKTGLDFSKMRVISEQLAREKSFSTTNQEITLDEIYKTINAMYHVDEKILDKMKKREIELELRFCKIRDVGKELYTFAYAVGKKIIITSDMYLPMDVIKKILENNGYKDHVKIYLSSEIKLTKATGDLYLHIIEDLKVSANSILHIGDNKDSDIKEARKRKLAAKHLPKAIDIALDTEIAGNMFGIFTANMPIFRDNCAALQFLGVRTMLAMVANKYFDNPFKSFNRWSDFNSDPYLVGYYALGMYLFGIVKWILDDCESADYNKMVFMSRDGYLPMKAYKVMKKLYKNAPMEDYVYVSRKALLPITLMDKLDFYRLSDIINISNHTPKSILKYIEGSLNTDEASVEAVLNEHNIPMNRTLKTVKNFNRFISVVLDNFYDEKKNKKTILTLKKYFSSIYDNHSATFDVGYSARPELYLSNLCNYPIDTYFLNINTEEAIKNSQLGGFKLKTFFDSKPAVTGFAYESMLSSLDPSCIGYKIEGENVVPIFEDNNVGYPEKFMSTIMQNAAMDFINDMVDTFGEDIKNLYYQKEYLSLPIMAFINSSLDVDRNIFSAIIFEDDVRLNKSVDMVTEWKKEVGYKNQRYIYELVQRGGTYNYNNIENRSRPIRVLYYMLYDRQEFKNKMKVRLKDHKILYSISRNSYSALRNIKNTIKRTKKREENE